MLSRIEPFQFDRKVGNGRTDPARLTCNHADGSVVEVIAKLSSKCDRGTTALAMEVFSACLAADLHLPIPTPYLVELDPEWIDTIVDTEWAQHARQSITPAFASRALSGGFRQWVSQTPILGPMTSVAAAIFLFDAITDNADRRDGNPNCLIRGDELRIIDHELTFPDTRGIFGWREPWLEGSLHHLESPGAHIFREQLRRRDVDWEPIEARWRALSDDRLADYAAAIPAEWAAGDSVDAATTRVRGAREHIGACVAEVRRVLS